MSTFQFGNVVVVEDDEIGVIVKSWEDGTHDVYIRSYNGVRKYPESEIKHFFYSERNEHIKIGSRWYVQLHPRAPLVEREVIDKTDCTVELEDPHSLSRYNTARYRLDEIAFVEPC